MNKLLAFIFLSIGLITCAWAQDPDLVRRAESGEAPAQNNLGVMYEQGTTVNQNYQEAIKWFTAAANQGNTEAQTNLGVMYELGRGVEQNNQEAIRWYRMAAERGDEYAQEQLFREPLKKS